MSCDDRSLIQGSSCVTSIGLDFYFAVVAGVVVVFILFNGHDAV